MDALLIAVQQSLMHLAVCCWLAAWINHPDAIELRIGPAWRGGHTDSLCQIRNLAMVPANEDHFAGIARIGQQRMRELGSRYL